MLRGSSVPLWRRMRLRRGMELLRRSVLLVSRVWLRSLAELGRRVVLGGLTVHPIRMRVVLRVPPVPVFRVLLGCELRF